MPDVRRPAPEGEDGQFGAGQEAQGEAADADAARDVKLGAAGADADGAAQAAPAVVAVAHAAAQERMRVGRAVEGQADLAAVGVAGQHDVHTAHDGLGDAVGGMHQEQGEQVGGDAG